MLDKSRRILYVGKAKSLKSRVNSYFNKNHTHPKTAALVQRIDDIEIIITGSESQALLLEQTLIKQHKPPYNVILRDDKSYLYVYVDDGDFPKVAIGRGKQGMHKQFFGPYPSAQGAKEAMLLVQKLFLLRNCSDNVFASAKRPCLEYQIKRCTAPCVGFIDKENYQASVAQALQFLQGDTGALQENLTAKMHECAQNMQFEQAVFYRDKLALLSKMSAEQAVYRLDGEADVFAISCGAGLMCVHVMTVRKGKVLGGQSYFPNMLMLDDGLGGDGVGEQLQDFILSFYSNVSLELPKEIIVTENLPDKQTVEKLLGDEFGQKTTIKQQVQTYRKQWQQMAQLNADNALKSQLLDYQELQQRFFELSKVLAGVSDKTINRIECFDISHTMGEMAVGSCVVFDTMGARRREYRQYAISGIMGGDDYAAMRQVLTRRYGKHALPDLLLIDGGKGQLAVAKTVLDELGVTSDTILMSVAKGEGRKAGLEILHFMDHEPIDLPHDNKALHLIMQIRDEAHRFAITAHRKKRDKARSGSVLEVIPNLGEVRRRALLAHFGGIRELLGASQDDIAKVKGIGKTLANTIYKALHE